jgi:hypothetical protein
VYKDSTGRAFADDSRKEDLRSNDSLEGGLKSLHRRVRRFQRRSLIVQFFYEIICRVPAAFFKIHPDLSGYFFAPDAKRRVCCFYRKRRNLLLETACTQYSKSHSGFVPSGKITHA